MAEMLTLLLGTCDLAPLVYTHTVAVNKKLTFRCRRNDRATMRIVLKKRL